MKDKVVIVTGASRGIGRGLALHLARAGASLAVTGRKPDRLAEISAELDALGAPHIAVPVDQADREGAIALAERTVAEFGRIDGLVANAQTFRSVTPLEDVSARDMDLLLDTGPKGVLWMMQAVFPAMRGQGWGRIVTMGSNAALLGAAGYGPYVAAKEAIRGLTRVAAREWGKHGIIVNCACPISVAHRSPPTDSDDATAGNAVRKAVFDAAFKDNPLARDGVIEDDIAPVVEFLLSEGCSYVTGQTFMIDGGAIMRT
jgi:NAD(P)-dependent dehydrogenase (short-subunit alcohol dehydrogenase family)